MEVWISKGMYKMEACYPFPRLLSLLLFYPVWVMQMPPSIKMLLMWRLKTPYLKTKQNQPTLALERTRSQHLLLATSHTLLYTTVWFLNQIKKKSNKMYPFWYFICTYCIIAICQSLQNIFGSLFVWNFNFTLKFKRLWYCLVNLLVFCFVAVCFTFRRLFSSSSENAS